MLERLAGLEQEYEAVLTRLQDPALFSDQRQLRDVSRRQKALEPIVLASRELRRAHDDLDGAKERLTDAEGDAREMLRAAVEEAETAIARLEDELKLLLLPK